VPLIYGNDSSPKHPVSKLTWIALVSDAVLLVYWAFIVWTLGDPFDRPDWVNSPETGYYILFSWGVSFFAGLITIAIAIAGVGRARKAYSGEGGRSNVLGVVALVAACLLNTAIVLPVLLVIANG
jgi:hypothetical protein